MRQKRHYFGNRMSGNAAPLGYWMWAKTCRMPQGEWMVGADSAWASTFYDRQENGFLISRRAGTNFWSKDEKLRGHSGSPGALRHRVLWLLAGLYVHL